MTDLIVERTALDDARAAFRLELLDAGLLIATSSPGVYGRSGVFESVITGLDRVLTDMAAPLNATAVRFPPVYPRADFERTDYIASFPDLSGVVSSFEAGDREHRELLGARERGERWDGWLTPADVVLTNAICHPLYATLEGVTHPGGSVPGGNVWDVFGYGFRHEPSLDPMRLQSFRMHEWVYVGDADGAQAYRDTWVDIATATLESLGLPVTQVAANDPFFGRAGKMLVSAQLRENLKIELTVPMYGELHEGTAIASANCQRDHLTAAFGIRTPDGEIAHASCLAFGMERTVLALLRTHGLDVTTWPVDVKASLGL
jgi:seryl-tRNA synthetase